MSIVLSDDDLRVLKELLDRVKRSFGESPKLVPDFPLTTSEVYVAKTPGGGVPALTGATPGTAACEVYELRMVSGSVTLISLSPLVQDVYNVSPIVLPAGEYVVIRREKFGFWVIDRDCCFPNPFCSPCMIESDDFNRADNTDLGSKWYEHAGGWGILSNVLYTPDDNAKVYSTGVHPYNNASNVVDVDIRGDSPNDQLQVIVYSGDADNYLSIEIQVASGIGNDTCGLIELVRVDAGARVVIDSLYARGVVKDVWIPVRACYHCDEDEYAACSGTLFAKVTAGGRSHYLGDPNVTKPSGSWPYEVGLGTRNINATTGTGTAYARFDDFCWRRHRTEIATYPGTGTGTVSSEPDCPACNFDPDETCLIWLLVCDIPTAPPCDWVIDSVIPNGWLCNSTTGSFEVLRTRDPDPDDLALHKMEALLHSTASGTEFMLYVSYKSQTEYLAARLTVHATCGTLAVVKDGTVLDSIPCEQATHNKNLPLCVEFDGSFLKAHLSLDDPNYNLTYRHLKAAATAPAGYIYSAIGVESNSGTATFTGVSVTRPWVSETYDGCGVCDTCNLNFFIGADVDAVCEWYPQDGTINRFNTYGLEFIGAGWAMYKGNDGANHCLASARVRFASFGQKFRIYVNDQGNVGGPTGVYGEIEFNGSSSVFRLSTGHSETVALTVNTDYTLLVCLRGTTLQATIDQNKTSIPVALAALRATLGAAQTGLYVVFQHLGSSATLYVDVPSYLRHYLVAPVGTTNCGDCVTLCSAGCLNAFYPDTLIVEITGTSPCGISTSGVDGVHEVSYSSCSASGGLYAGSAGGKALTVLIAGSGSPGNTMVVTVTVFIPTQGTIVWRKTVTNNDCFALSSEQITFFSAYDSCASGSLAYVSTPP